jgi:hypothetical protein
MYRYTILLHGVTCSLLAEGSATTQPGRNCGNREAEGILLTFSFAEDTFLAVLK